MQPDKMSNKSDKHFLFETDLAWLHEKRTVLSARDVEGTIYVETPPAFGGKGKPWAPEHLFLGSISSCFTVTFLAFAEKMRFTIKGMKCNAIGQVELVDGHYQFTQVDLYPTLFLNENDLAIGSKALEKTHQHCLITRSLGIEVFYHSVLKTGVPDTEDEKWLSRPIEGNSANIIV